jgi:hypothetical protein
MTGTHDFGMRILSFHERYEGNAPSTHNRLAESPLMPSTGACHSPGQYLAPLGKMVPQELHVLVIYELHLFGAKSAELSSLESSLWCCHAVSFLYLLSLFSLERLKIRRLIGRCEIVRRGTLMRTLFFPATEKPDALRDNLEP